MKQFTCVSLGMYQVFYSIIRESLPFSNYADFREETFLFMPSSLNITVQGKQHHYHIVMGFPGGSVVENLPANAGNTGSIPHPLKQLSPCATTIEPVL